MEIYGNNTVRELPDERRRRNGRWQTVKRWQGTEDAIRAFVPNATSDPLDEVDITATGDGIEFILSVTAASALDGSDPNSEANTVTSWNAITQVEQKDILSHPKFEALGNEVKRKALQTFHDNPAGDPPGYVSGDEQSFENAIKAGQTDFLYPVATIQRNVSLPAGAVLGDLSQYIAKVFTRAQIVSVFDPPANILAQMPTGGSAGEWLCMKSDLTQTDKGGWQVVQEFANRPAWSFVYTRWT